MNVIDTKDFPMDHQQFIGWYNRCGGKEIFEAKDAIESDHEAAIAMESAKRWLARHPRASYGSIVFPTWVKTTECKTRTFKVVLPRDERYNPHGTLVIERSFPNRPTVTAPRIGLPGFYTKWADGK
jgi:hypothetical protein